MEQDERRAGLEGLYAAYAPSVRRYLRQRTDAATADDLLSDVFVVAWRRLEKIPPDPVPWLLACARNVLAHSQRSERRRAALIDRLRNNTHPESIAVGDGRSRLAEALATLAERDREALLLIAWDDLSPGQAAAVLGCSRRAFAMRLHRARRRLAAALSTADHPEPPTLMEACSD
jgi:RNA polymerase sigma-70 factor (ECF subfamily)